MRHRYRLVAFFAVIVCFAGAFFAYCNRLQTPATVSLSPTVTTATIAPISVGTTSPIPPDNTLSSPIPTSSPVPYTVKALNNISGVKQNGNQLILSIGADTLSVEVCGQAILKVDYLPQGLSSPPTGVLGADPVCPVVAAKIDVSADPLLLSTSEMTIKIARQPCRLSVYDAQNKLLLKEQDLGGVNTSGVKFNHNASDNFYGVRIQQSGLLRNSGDNVSAGSQGDGSGPFIWSTAGYGLLVDSDGGYFNVTKDELDFSFIRPAQKNLPYVNKIDVNYYIMLGKPADIISAATFITGKPPMFPKWASGFTNTQWGSSQKEIEQIIKTYRANNEPIDQFVFDFDWKAWGEDNYGEFRWNTTKFPDGPSGLFAKNMNDLGLKLGGILKPRIITPTVESAYAVDHGFLFPNQKPYTDYASGKPSYDLNFALADVRSWFWSHQQPAFDSGIWGMWNDEADLLNNNFQFMNMQRALYEGQRAHVDKRVWSINRNFYLGSQRYAYAMWSGDIKTGFTSMANQRGDMLAAVSLGEAQWGMDTGGFSGTPDSENYARWMEFDAFVPVFRVHGGLNEKRQPWVYGPTAEAAAKNAMQLRYRLLPYIYSYQRQASETGVGLVKPLFFDYPGDPKTASYVDAWMFGDYFLVAPVVAQGQKVKSIYLPAGTWIDYKTGVYYKGGQTIDYPVDDVNWSDIPLFVKSGAIIPSQDFQNYVGEKPVNNIYVDIFPAATPTSFRYYDDDGVTYAYEKGAYFAQTMTIKSTTGTNDIVNIDLSPKTGTYSSPDLKAYIFKAHGTGAATHITNNGATLTEYNTLTELLAASGEGWATGTDTFGAVNFIKVTPGNAAGVVVSSVPVH